MYYYGARYYDPRISIFVSVDPLAEQFVGWTPYHYVHQNPINLIDPTGMSAENSDGGGWLNRAWNNVKTEVKSWFRNDKRDITLEFGELTGIILPDNEPNKNVTSATAGAIAVGTAEGVVGSGSALGGIGSYLSAALPHLAVIVGSATLVQGETRREDPGMYLYRGVAFGHPDYANALQGMAVPYGLNGGHSDPEAHNTGSYNSIYTSWSMSRGVADYHANKGKQPGVVLMKKFMLHETVPSPDEHHELEVLVPGIVRGADVQRPLGRGTPTAY